MEVRINKSPGLRNDLLFVMPRAGVEDALFHTANGDRLMREQCLPRNKFLHGCLGFSDEEIIILQREGTIEEMAHVLAEAGAPDGFILENGGSPACRVRWPLPDGGFLFQAPDYRPDATAIIAFVLRGPARTDRPPGSVSYTVL